ncbi:hypothetical protein JX580_09675 [Thiomicrospira microaerophila]|uniref:hypothetical protein n=1 Tax=Thiomicrospira microaerophila TaxID=406020 RepID=UPI0020102ADF|nr:hypothetical protein [Thiomicrospira microaerophila]UQB41925.1 hypothetical protein JX580_09675 [Thiomicrospira microaerophila]
MDISEELAKIAMRNLEHNKSDLIGLKVKLDNYLNDKNAGLYLSHLYSGDINEDWFEAQCKSACNQIEKIVDSKSKFNEFYKNNLTENDLVLLTRELISDISLLNQISGGRFALDCQVSRDNYLSSHQFFLHAKFSYFTHKNIPETTCRSFNFSTMPTLIRQSIEVKLKNMIRLEKVEKIGGGFKFVPISSLLDFFANNTDLIEFPVCLNLLKAINEWTNSFVHTGVVPFCWQSLEAVDLIEDLFSIKDDASGSLSLHGFSYFKPNVTISDLQLALNNHFKAEFTLSEMRVEGCVIRS